MFHILKGENSTFPGDLSIAFTEQYLVFQNLKNKALKTVSTLIKLAFILHYSKRS